MPNRFDGRLDRIEDRVLVGEGRKARIRDLTISANLNRVPTVILVEALLASLEEIAFPGEPSRRPEFIDRELLRPVSAEELDLAAREESRWNEADWSDSEKMIRVSWQQLEEYAQQIREILDSLNGGEQQYIPIGYQYEEWDALEFLARWDRVKEKLALR